MGFWDGIVDVIKGAARVITGDTDSYSTTDKLSQYSKDKIEKINTDGNKSNDINTAPIIDNARQSFSDSVSQDIKGSFSNLGDNIINAASNPIDFIKDTGVEAVNSVAGLGNAFIQGADTVTNIFQGSKDWISDGYKIKPWDEDTNGLFSIANDFGKTALKVADDSTNTINQAFKAEDNDSRGMAATKRGIRNGWNLASDVALATPRGLVVATNLTDGEFSSSDAEDTLDFGRSLVSRFGIGRGLAGSSASKIAKPATTWAGKAINIGKEFIDSKIGGLAGDAIKGVFGYAGYVALPGTVLSAASEDALDLGGLSDNARKTYSSNQIEEASNGKIKDGQGEMFYQDAHNDFESFKTRALEINSSITEDEAKNMYNNYLGSITKNNFRDGLNGVSKLFKSTQDDNVETAEYNRVRDDALAAKKETDPVVQSEANKMISDIYGDLYKKGIITKDSLEVYNDKFSVAAFALQKTLQELSGDYNREMMKLNNLSKEGVEKSYDGKSTIQELKDKQTQAYKDQVAIYVIRNSLEAGGASREEAMNNSIKQYFGETDIAKAREKFNNILELNGENIRITTAATRASEGAYGGLGVITTKLKGWINEGINAMAGNQFAAEGMSRLYTEIGESDFNNSLQKTKENIGDIGVIVLAEVLGKGIAGALEKTVFKNVVSVKGLLGKEITATSIDSLLVDPTQSALFAGIDNDRTTIADAAMSSLSEAAAGATSILRVGQSVNTKINLPTTAGQWKAIITDGKTIDGFIDNTLTKKIDNMSWAINETENEIANKTKELSKNTNSEIILGEITVLNNKIKAFKDKRDEYTVIKNKDTDIGITSYNLLRSNVDDSLTALSNDFVKATNSFPKTEAERAANVWRSIVVDSAFGSESQKEQAKAEIKRGAEYMLEAGDTANTSTMLNRMYNYNVQDTKEIKPEQEVNSTRHAYLEEQKNFVMPTGYKVNREKSIPYSSLSVANEVLDENNGYTGIYEIKGKYGIQKYVKMKQSFMGQKIEFLPVDNYFKAGSIAGYTNKVVFFVGTIGTKTKARDKYIKENNIEDYTVISSDDGQLNKNDAIIKMNEAISLNQPIFIQLSGLFDANMINRWYDNTVGKFQFNRNSIQVVKTTPADAETIRRITKENIDKNNKGKSTQELNDLFDQEIIKYITAKGDVIDTDVSPLAAKGIEIKTEESLELKITPDELIEKVANEAINESKGDPLDNSIENTLSQKAPRNKSNAVTKEQEKIMTKVLKKNNTKIIIDDSVDGVDVNVVDNEIVIGDNATKGDMFIASMKSGMGELYKKDEEFNGLVKQGFNYLTKKDKYKNLTIEEFIENFFEYEKEFKKTTVSGSKAVNKTIIGNILSYLGKIIGIDFNLHEAIQIEFKIRNNISIVSSKNFIKKIESIIAKPDLTDDNKKFIKWALDNIGISSDDSAVEFVLNEIKNKGTSASKEYINNIIDFMFTEDTINTVADNNIMDTNDIKLIVANDAVNIASKEIIQNTNVNAQIVNTIENFKDRLLRTQSSEKTKDKLAGSVNKMLGNKNGTIQEGQTTFLIDKALEGKESIPTEKIEEIVETVVVINALKEKNVDIATGKAILKKLDESDKIDGLYETELEQGIIDTNNPTNLLEKPDETILKIKGDLAANKISKSAFEKRIDFWKQTLVNEVIFAKQNGGRYMMKQFSYIMKTVFGLQNIGRPMLGDIAASILWEAKQIETAFENSAAFIEYDSSIASTNNALKNIYDIKLAKGVNLNSPISNEDLIKAVSGMMKNKINFYKEDFVGVFKEGGDLDVEININEETGNFEMVSSLVSSIQNALSTDNFNAVINSNTIIDFNALHDLVQEKIGSDKSKDLVYGDIVEGYVVEDIYKKRADIDMGDYKFGNQLADLASYFGYKLRGYHTGYKTAEKIAKYLYYNTDYIEEGSVLVQDKEKDFPFYTAKIDTAIEGRRGVPVQEIRKNILFMSALGKLLGDKNTIVENIIKADNLTDTEKVTYQKYIAGEKLSTIESIELQLMQDSIFEGRKFFKTVMGIPDNKTIIIDKDQTYSSNDLIPNGYEYAGDVTGSVYFNNQDGNKPIGIASGKPLIDSPKNIYNIVSRNGYTKPTEGTTKIIGENYGVVFVSNEGKLSLYKKVPSANIEDVLSDTNGIYSPGTTNMTIVDSFDIDDTGNEDIDKMIKTKKEGLIQREIDLGKKLISEARAGEISFVKLSKIQKDGLVAKAKNNPKEFGQALKNIVNMYSNGIKFEEGELTKEDLNKISKSNIIDAIYNSNAKDMYVKATKILKSAGILLDTKDGFIKKVETINNLILSFSKTKVIPSEFSYEMGLVIDAINYMKEKMVQTGYMTEYNLIESILEADQDSFNKKAIGPLLELSIETRTGIKTLYSILSKYGKYFNVRAEANSSLANQSTEFEDNFEDDDESIGQAITSSNNSKIINSPGMNLFVKILSVIETDKDIITVKSNNKGGYFAGGMRGYNVLQEGDKNYEAKVYQWIKKEIDFLDKKRAPKSDYKILANYISNTVGSNLKNNKGIEKGDSKRISNILSEKFTVDKKNIILTSPFTGSNVAVIRGTKGNDNVNLKNTLDVFKETEAYKLMFKEYMINEGTFFPRENATEIYNSDIESLFVMLNTFKKDLNNYNTKSKLGRIKAFDINKKIITLDQITKENIINQINEFVAKVGSFIDTNPSDAEASLINQKVEEPGYSPEDSSFDRFMAYDGTYPSGISKTIDNMIITAIDKRYISKEDADTVFNITDINQRAVALKSFINNAESFGQEIYIAPNKIFDPQGNNGFDDNRYIDEEDDQYLQYAIDTQGDLNSAKRLSSAEKKVVQEARMLLKSTEEQEIEILKVEREYQKELAANKENIAIEVQTLCN